MKVLVLTKYGRKGSSSRVRFYQYMPLLEQSGISFNISPLLDDSYVEDINNNRRSWSKVFISYAKRFTVMFHVYRYDLIWIEKEILPGLPAILERCLSLLGIKYIVDYDDATFHSYDCSSNIIKRVLHNKIAVVMRNSRSVICGNSYLANYAMKAAKAKVIIVPSVVDTDKYIPEFKNKNNQNIIIGWIGSPSTKYYLDIVAAPLKRLSREYNICLRVIGAEYQSEQFCVENRPWSEDSEISEINEFDIGIMPLYNSQWEQGKCGYKLIQCMACGKPVVASAVGVNMEIVDNGENGYLAENDDEWYMALKNLCSSTELADKLGRNGRKLVESKYSLKSQVDQIKMALYSAP